MLILLVITSATNWATIIGGAVAVIAFLGALYFGYFKGQRLSGEMARKDEVIKTREQLIAAFEDRISLLESDLGRLVGQAKLAETTIIQLRSELAALNKYAAPQAFERLDERLARMEKLLIELQASHHDMKRRS